MLGVLVLLQSLDLTDVETVNQLASNIQWHYALNITEKLDSAKYFGEKTLWNMRRIAVEDALVVIEILHSDRLSRTAFSKGSGSRKAAT